MFYIIIAVIQAGGNLACLCTQVAATVDQVSLSKSYIFANKADILLDIGFSCSLLDLLREVLHMEFFFFSQAKILWMPQGSIW